MFNWDKMSLTQRLIWLKNRANGGSGEFGELATVEGYTGPMILPNAINKNIKSLVLQGRFSAEQWGTLPDGGFNITMNSGSVGIIHQSGLSPWYILCEDLFINRDAIPTNFVIKNRDKIIIDFKILPEVSGKKAVYAVRDNTALIGFYADGTFYGIDKDGNTVDTGVPVDREWHRIEQDYSKGTLKLDDRDPVYFEPFDFNLDYNFCIFAENDQGVYKANATGYIRNFKVIRNNKVVFDAIPAKSQNNNIGMCDVVSDYFIVGGNLAGAELPDPYVVKISPGDAKLFLNRNQIATQADLLSIQEPFFDEQDIISGRITRRVGYHIFDGTETWIKATNGWITEDITDVKNVSFQPLCTCFKGVAADSPAMNSVRMYYTDGGKARTYFKVDMTRFDTVEKWTSFVKDKYSATSPVILFYPLADEYSESVKPQRLKTVKGDDKIEVTEYATPYGIVQYYIAKQ